MSADVDPVAGFRALEDELCRIPDVTATRVVADAFGRPAEVHVLASPAKHAKQIVRDVQSVAIASLGIELDRRIISVVQLPLTHDQVSTGSPHLVVQPPGGPTPDVKDSSEQPLGAGPAALVPNGPERIRLDGVSAVTSGTLCTAQVVVRRRDDTVVGTAEGVGVSGAAARLVARATLSAVGQLEAAAARCELESAVIVRVGERLVALTTVVFAVPPYEEVVSGAAVVRAAGEHDAVARAVLDATNRRLGFLTRD